MTDKQVAHQFSIHVSVDSDGEPVVEVERPQCAGWWQRTPIDVYGITVILPNGKQFEVRRGPQTDPQTGRPTGGTAKVVSFGTVERGR